MVVTLIVMKNINLQKMYVFFDSSPYNMCVICVKLCVFSALIEFVYCFFLCV